MLAEGIFVLELGETMPLDLIDKRLDGLLDEAGTTDATTVEEVFLLLVLDEDEAFVRLDLLGDAVAVLGYVCVDEAESSTLLDLIVEIVATGFSEDDDDLATDLIDDGETLVAEDDLLVVDEGTESDFPKTHLQACFTAGTFKSGTGESILCLLTIVSEMGP